MAYSELIKNFSRIRDYMREFYVYGFRSRDEYTKKSSRSYDDERRRIESWLGDWMSFRQTAEGRNVFLSIDSRITHHNPLFRAWKAKSFTDGDITLHFILFDILDSPQKALSLNEITESVDHYVSTFTEPRMFDASTIRKKLREYVSEGIITADKKGRTLYYRRSEAIDAGSTDVLDFFSEVAPCGVVGSYLLDKCGEHGEYLAFKHHYITGAMDSEIVCSLFEAMGEKRYVSIEVINRRREKTSGAVVIPLRIMIGVQSGRQYLMAYSRTYGRITSFRTDSIISVRAGDVCESFDEYREKLDGMLPHIWGVSTRGTSGQRMEHVEFTIHYRDDETYIPQRLEREKRCGTVEMLGNNTCLFSADVFDSGELVPWIRTFICRITDISFSNKKLEDQFRSDIREMYRMYGLNGGGSGDLQ